MNLPSAGALAAAMRGRGWFRRAQAKSEPGEVEQPQFMAPIHVHRCRLQLSMNLPSAGALSAAMRGRGWFRRAQAKSEPGEVEQPRFMAPIHVHRCRLKLSMNPALRRSRLRRHAGE